MGRPFPSLISDSLIPGHPGHSTFFSSGEVLAQSTDPCAGSEQCKDAPSEPGGAGACSLTVPWGCQREVLFTAGWPYLVAAVPTPFPRTGAVVGQAHMFKAERFTSMLG